MKSMHKVYYQVLKAFRSRTDYDPSGWFDEGVTLQYIDKYAEITFNGYVYRFQEVGSQRIARIKECNIKHILKKIIVFNYNVIWETVNAI